MGKRSTNTTKSGKYMNPTDQARKEARKHYNTILVGWQLVIINIHRSLTNWHHILWLLEHSNNQLTQLNFK